MLKKVLLGLGAAVAAVALLATAVEAQIVTLPTGLGPGEEYRLVFFTSTDNGCDVNQYRGLQRVCHRCGQLQFRN